METLQLFLLFRRRKKVVGSFGWLWLVGFKTELKGLGLAYVGGKLGLVRIVFEMSRGVAVGLAAWIPY
jgi:hypothetical protein